MFRTTCVCGRTHQVFDHRLHWCECGRSFVIEGPRWDSVDLRYLIYIVVIVFSVIGAAWGKALATAAGLIR